MSFAWFLPTGFIAVAMVLDVALGDPAALPHPVRLIGWLIAFGERHLRCAKPASDLRRGGLLATLVMLLVGGAVWLLIWAAAQATPALGALVALILAWTTLALRELDQAAARVEQALGWNDLGAARRRLPALVGRDPASLDEVGIARAVIESVAENSSDGVIAPLFYLFLGGPLAAMVYKAINTMDSMIGYTDSRYLYFGRAAARLDDLANYLPARLSALCLVVAAQFINRRGRFAWETMVADGRRHRSPNAGLLEAAMAGALGIQLGGEAYYEGELEPRPLMGRAQRPLRIADIRLARTMMWTQTLFAFLLMATVRALLGLR